ncbi:MAG: glycosyltransferase family 9 protein [Desulfovibrionaceae bacterium]|nr:glycosyltransferase family 9 protein [Desulfovibrionaceae bacterium]
MSERGSQWRRMLDYWLGIPLVAASSLLRLRKASTLPSAFQPRQIAFLCLGAIGDLLLLSSVITALRARLPSATITLITSRANAAAAHLVPGLDYVCDFSLNQIDALIFFVRRLHCDIFFDASQWARIGALIANVSDAAYTVGFATKGQMRHFGYSIAVRHRSDQHEYKNFLDLGRALYPDLEGQPSLCLPSSHSESEAFSLAYAEKNAVYLHMWPSGICAELKEWPAQSWASLCQILTGAGYAVYLTGAPGDAEKNAAFLARNPNPRVQSLAGLVSLGDLALLFSRARAVVSVNTGIMHLAAIIGAPTVGLHGPTNPLRWGPWGPKVASLLPDHPDCAYLNLGFEYSSHHKPCMPYLSVASVCQALFSFGLSVQAGSERSQP